MKQILIFGNNIRRILAATTAILLRRPFNQNIGATRFEQPASPHGDRSTRMH